MQAASNKILTSKSSNCSITSSSKVFPAICNKAIESCTSTKMNYQQDLAEDFITVLTFLCRQLCQAKIFPGSVSKKRNHRRNTLEHYQASTPDILPELHTQLGLI